VVKREPEVLLVTTGVVTVEAGVVVVGVVGAGVVDPETVTESVPQILVPPLAQTETEVEPEVTPESVRVLPLSVVCTGIGFETVEIK
jgi:malic enzyme